MNLKQKISNQKITWHPRILFTALCAATFVSLAALISQASVEPTRFRDESRKLELQTALTGWAFFEDTDDKKGIVFIARSPEVTAGQTQATLTLRADISNQKTAALYSEKWLKEYPKFGFELVMSRDARYGSFEGYEMELKNKESTRRVRQFVVLRQDEFLIFTCSSPSESFERSWAACERMLKTLKAL